MESGMAMAMIPVADQLARKIRITRMARPLPQSASC